jgi:hypothetical protein
VSRLILNRDPVIHVTTFFFSLNVGTHPEIQITCQYRIWILSFFFSLKFPLQFFYVSFSLIVSSLSSSLVYFLFLISLSSHSQNKELERELKRNQRRGSKSLNIMYSFSNPSNGEYIYHHHSPISTLWPFTMEWIKYPLDQPCAYT